MTEVSAPVSTAEGSRTETTHVTSTRVVEAYGAWRDFIKIEKPLEKNPANASRFLKRELITTPGHVLSYPDLEAGLDQIIAVSRKPRHELEDVKKVVYPFLSFTEIGDVDRSKVGEILTKQLEATTDKVVNARRRTLGRLVDFFKPKSES